MAALSLVDVLAEVPDPRGFHGRVPPLPAVLGLVALALLMGRKSLAGVARFGRQYGTPLAHALGFRRGKTASVSTLSRTSAFWTPPPSKPPCRVGCCRGSIPTWNSSLGTARLSKAAATGKSPDSISSPPTPLRA